MQWSTYSEALFDAWKYTNDNLLVTACPGAGKTTNIQHICTDLVSPRDETLYLAFNVAPVNEAKGKLPTYMRDNIMTINGLGHKAIINEYGSVNLDANKVYTIARKEVRQGRLETRRDYQERISEIVKAVNLMKLELSHTSTTFFELCDTYDIDDYPAMYEECLRVLDVSDYDTNTIDWNDQLRFPILYNLPMRSYDNVMIDETQDLNPIQMELVKRLHARYCFVGDQHQSIYAFRGAMHDSMDTIKAEFNCIELPLKLTYRCPKLVVAEASKLFNDIEALETAPDGEVCHGKPVQVDYTVNDLILCRLNAPLVQYAYRLLKQGIPCHVRGRDIGAGLVRLIDKLPCATIAQLIDALWQWHDVEESKAREKGNYDKLQRIDDRFDSLMVFARQCNLSDSPLALKTRITKMFSSGNGVPLSTIHKAKGLEAQRVYILDHDNMPLPWATKPWEVLQERNMQYVAVTRAKHTLVYM